MKKSLISILLGITAVSANAGTIFCEYEILRSERGGRLATFESAADCRAALSKAKIATMFCEYEILRSERGGRLATFESAADCIAALSKSN